MEIIQVDDDVALLYDMRVEGTVDVIDGLFDVDGSMRLSDTGTFVSAIDRINDWFSTFQHLALIAVHCTLPVKVVCQ